MQRLIEEIALPVSDSAMPIRRVMNKISKNQELQNVNVRAFFLPFLFVGSFTSTSSGTLSRIVRFPLVEKILHWRHSGFSVHSQVRAESKSEAERVGKHMIRPLLSLKRLFFDEKEGKVRYQHSRHGSQEESMDYPEFIA